MLRRVYGLWFAFAVNVRRRVLKMRMGFVRLLVLIGLRRMIRTGLGLIGTAS